MDDLDNEKMLTLNHLIDVSIERFADRPALSEPFGPTLTYRALGRRLRDIAALLAAEGIGKGDGIAILAENSCNWGIACLAAMRVGGVVVPILPDLPGADVRHILRDSGAGLLFTTRRQLAKIHPLRDHRLIRVVTLDDHGGGAGQFPPEPFSRFLDRAARLARQRPGPGEPRTAAAVAGEDVASIIYTSGSSHHAKAVVLSHRNFRASVASAARIIAIEPEWVFLSILPLAHAFEFTLGFLLPLFRGASIVYPGGPPTPTLLEKVCRQVRPAVVCAVPMVVEKLYRKRVRRIIDRNGILRLAVRWPPARRWLYRRCGRDLLAFFGGRLRVMAIGGAPLDPEVERFLAEAGFPYLAGYGLTEAAPLLAAGPFGDPEIAIGSAGKPVPGVEIRIRHPDPLSGIGEIAARGPNVMREYFNDPAGTARVLDPEGWLATGDLGFLDRHGNLFVKGRSKNVIVLASGEKVFPEAVEHRIDGLTRVKESLVREQNGRLEALIHPDYDLIDRETAGRSEAERRAYIEELLRNLRREVNAGLPPGARIARFIEQQQPFARTATRKIKRYLYQGTNPEGG